MTVDFNERTIDFSTDKATTAFNMRLRQMIYRHCGIAMRKFGSLMARFFTLIGVTGCDSAEITEPRSYVGFGKIARTDRMIVIDFAAIPAGMPDDSLLAGRYAQYSAPRTREKIEAGRKPCAQVA